MANEEKNNDFIEAEKIIVYPTEKNDIQYLSFNNTPYRRQLNNKIVQVGDTVKLIHIKSEFEGFGFPHLQNVPNHHMILIHKTIPDKKVKITEKTDVEYLFEKPNEDGLPISQIIDVKKIPNMENCFEVINLSQLSKLITEGTIIHRFENEKQIIYLVGNYFFIKKK